MEASIKAMLLAVNQKDVSSILTLPAKFRNCSMGKLASWLALNQQFHVRGVVEHPDF